jgi:hypothetical protein
MLEERARAGINPNDALKRSETQNKVVGFLFDLQVFTVSDGVRQRFNHDQECDFPLSTDAFYHRKDT